MKILSVIAWVASLALAGCSNTSLPKGLNLEQLVTFPAAPVLEQTQEDCQLSVQGLTEKELLTLAQEEAAPSPEQPFITVAIKLRVQSKDGKLTVPELLAIQAPSYSEAQAQDALFYHMSEAGYLQLAGTQVRPQAAYTEMTTQRERWLNIVFMFRLSRRALATQNAIKFTLDKAFFLAKPAEFTLPASQLLPTS